MHVQIAEEIGELVGRTPEDREANPEPNRGEGEDDCTFLKHITECQ